MYGLTPDKGFTAKSRAEIEDSLKDLLADHLDLDEPDFSEHSTLGRLVRIETDRLVELWQTAKGVHDAGRLATAFGVSLDRLGETVNLFRLAGRPTLVTAHLSGKEGTVVPAGSLAKIEATGAVFAATEEAVISAENAVHAVVRVTEAREEMVNALRINGALYPESAGDPVQEDVVVEGDAHGLIGTGAQLKVSLTGFNRTNFPSGILYWEVAKFTQVLDTGTEDERDWEYIQVRIYKDKEKKWLVAHSTALPEEPPYEEAPVFAAGNQTLTDKNESGLSGSFRLNKFVADDDGENVLRLERPIAAVAAALKVQLQNELDADFPGMFQLDGSGDTIILENSENFSIEAGGYTEILSFLSPQTFASLELDEVPCGIGELSAIESPVSGWEGLSNPDEGFFGRPLESDSAFRERIRRSPRINSWANTGAMEQRLVQDVEVVDAVFVYENNTDAEALVTGQAPRSIHVIVDAPEDTGNGINEAIARKIWELKPVGIETWAVGDPPLLVPMADASGVSRDVYFSRAKRMYIWVKVTILKSDLITDEQKATAAAAIKEHVMAVGRTYGLGQGVSLQRFYTAAMELEGIRHARVQLLGSVENPDETAAVYDFLDIPVSETQKASFDKKRIQVAF